MASSLIFLLIIFTIPNIQHKQTNTHRGIQSYPTQYNNLKLIPPLISSIFIYISLSTMKSQILPLSDPFLTTSSSSSTMPTTSATAGTMLLGSKSNVSTSPLLISSPFEDEKSLEVKPFLSRALSYNSSTTTTTTTNTDWYQKRRRRIANDTSLSGSRRRHSFRQDVGRAASETYLIIRLSFKLLRYLGVGYRWVTRSLALGCYAFLLIPGFLQVWYYYFFSSQVRRGIVYGDEPRNSYKAWGSLLGLQLSERDMIVACIDYRNFPQGTMSDMVKDASQGISFVCNNIAEYGGDPNRIYLMGQSTGAHIAACALLEQVIKEAGKGEALLGVFPR